VGDAGVGGRLSRSRWRTRTMVHPIPSHCRSVWRGDDRLMGPHPSATSKRTDHCRCPNRHRVTPVGRHRTVRSGRSRNLSPSGVGMTLIGRRRTRPGLAIEVASPYRQPKHRRGPRQLHELTLGGIEDVESGPLTSAVTDGLRLEEAPGEGQHWRPSRMASPCPRTSTSSVWRSRGRRACEPTGVDPSR
jgi:hypothetical protein